MFLPSLVAFLKNLLHVDVSVLRTQGALLHLLDIQLYLLTVVHVLLHPCNSRPFLSTPQAFLLPCRRRALLRQRRPHAFFWVTEEPLPLFLRSLRPANRFATFFFAARPSFLGAPTNGFCLQMVSFLFCAENHKKSCSLSFLHSPGYTSDKPSSPLDPSAAPRPQSPLLYRRFCPGYFSIAAITLLSRVLQILGCASSLRLPLTFVRRRKRHLLWRRRHNPSSGVRKRYYWRSFKSHLSLSNAFGERKRLRLNKFPVRV